MMTDIWCFTCTHELCRVPGTTAYEHADEDNVVNGCPCVTDGERCQP